MEVEGETGGMIGGFVLASGCDDEHGLENLEHGTRFESRDERKRDLG